MNKLSKPQKPLWLRLIVLLLLIFGCLMVGNAIGAIIVKTFYKVNTVELLELFSNPAESNIEGAWGILMWVQAFTAIGGFIIGSISYMFFFERDQVKTLFCFKNTNLKLMGLVVFLMIAFMPFIGYLGQLNAAMDLPDSAFETLIKNKEEELKKLTIFLTNFDSITELMIAIFVIGIVPAIGEELLFRGILQRNLSKNNRNGHIAVWVSAIIFSAIHFQFYGFLPRMLIGALLGYLYLWSSNIWYPILAHLTNNGITVLMIYLYSKSMTKIDVDTKEMPMPIAMASLAIGVGLTYVFYKSIKGEALKNS